MNATKTMMKVVALFTVLLFAMPMVPAMYLGNQQAQKDLKITGPAVKELAPRFPTVVVGTTNTNAATSQNTARHVVRTNNGNIYVVYENNAQIWFSRSLDNGKTFSTPKNISNDTGANRGSYTPAIATNGTVIFVVYSYQDNTGANQGIVFRRSSDNGTTWTPALNQPATMLPHVASSNRPRYNPAIGVNGTAVYVVSNRVGGFVTGLFFYKSLDLGNTWGWGGANDELQLDNNANIAEASIAVSKENIYITYTENMGGGNDDILYTYSTLGKAITYNTNQFHATVNLYQANTDSRYPCVMANSTNVYVTWEERLQNHAQIYFRNTTNQGGAWTPAIGQIPTAVSASTGNARNPSVSLDGKGNVFVAWRDSAVDANYDIVYAERTGAVWDNNPTYITMNQNTATWPSTNPWITSNRLDIVWTNGTPTDVLYDGEYVGGSAPVLNWTGENGYTLDGVNPDTGTTGHTYTWRVKYTDADNDSPTLGYPMVYIDKDMSGNFNGPGEKITMNEVDAKDHTYTDGKLYTYSTRLKYVGLYNYTFAAVDSTTRMARGEPTKLAKGPQITSINEPPRLDWVQDWGYLTDGLNPETGFPDTNFTFKVAYTDVLNESVGAGFPKLYIDMNNDGNFTDPTDKVVSMIAVNPADHTYDNGKVYYYNTTLPVGTYKYYFYAEDLTGLSAQTPVKNGPTVISKGKPPVLSTTGEPGYITDGVSPTFGADTTQFNFRVKYTSPDGNMPATGYPVIGIDLNRDKNITTNEKFTMTEADSKDTTVKDGKIYTYSKVLGTLGIYKYQFVALDTNGTPSNILNFTGVNVNSTNRAPHLSWLGSVGFETDGLDPNNGNANTTLFHYQVIFSDPDNDKPMQGSPKVWIDMNLDGKESANEWFNMTDTNPASSDYINGKKYDYNLTLPTVGTYNYRFQAVDFKGAPANGDPTVKQLGPVVSVQPRQLPVLSFVGVGDYNGSGVSPAKGSLDTMFVYKVKYTDVQNFTPGLDYPRIYISTNGDGIYDKIVTMTPETTNNSVVNGKVYVYKTKLPSEGTNISYKFKAQDQLGIAASGTGSIYDQVFKGPTVVINKAPLLQFIGTGAFANKGVDPSSAVVNTTFNYRVTYKDPEGDKPKDGKVYLRIDLNQNRVMDASDPKIVMTEANPQDQNFAGAKEYKATYTFTTAGIYGYRFEATDIFNNTAGGPASADYLPGPTVTVPVPNRMPTLAFTGEVNFNNIGVNPISALKGTKFTFRVKYIDLDKDAPGNVYLTIGGQKYSMSPVDSSTDYINGKNYTVDVVMNKAQTYTYTFNTTNAIGQAATLGPVNGPVVTEKAAQSKSQVLPDMLWLILLIIVAIIVAIIGYLVGARRKREPEHEYRPAPRTRAPTRPPTRQRPDGLREAPMVPLSTAEVGEEPKKAEQVTEEPGPTAPEGDSAKSDLKASSEQPATGTEDAMKPEEKPGPPIAEETKPDLKDYQSDTEAPASDKDMKEGETTAKPEEKPAEEKKENVDNEIDSILAKLEK